VDLQDADDFIERPPWRTPYAAMHVQTPPQAGGILPAVMCAVAHYGTLITAQLSEHDPVARARSQLTGKELREICWGPNWDDNLAGTCERIEQDPLVRGIETQITASYEQASCSICRGSASTA
jgi:hypothetical protein